MHNGQFEVGDVVKGIPWVNACNNHVRIWPGVITEVIPPNDSTRVQYVIRNLEGEEFLVVDQIGLWCSIPENTCVRDKTTGREGIVCDPNPPGRLDCVYVFFPGDDHVESVKDFIFAHHLEIINE